MRAVFLFHRRSPLGWRGANVARFRWAKLAEKRERNNYCHGSVYRETKQHNSFRLAK